MANESKGSEAADKIAESETRRKQYIYGGLAVYVLGWIFLLLNYFSGAEDYQKVGNFTVLFFIAGGALGLIAGFGRPVAGDKFESYAKHAWKALSATVVAGFFLVFWLIIRSPMIDSMGEILAVTLIFAYFVFLYLIRLKAGDEEKRAKHVETAEVLVVAIMLAISIKAVGLQAFKIPSASMLHSLEIGDHLLITKFFYGIPLPYTDSRLPGFRDPKRGDIVVFAYPGYDNPDRPDRLQRMVPDPLKEQDFIKRIIGMPGETIEVRGAEVYIDGQRIDDVWGQYLDGKGNTLSGFSRVRCDDYGPVRIPEGMYFCMGDNRNHSNDSRVWGFVRKGRIKGNAVIIYWSWAGFSRIGKTLWN